MFIERKSGSPGFFFDQNFLRRWKTIEKRPPYFLLFCSPAKECAVTL